EIAFDGSSRYLASGAHAEVLFRLRRNETMLSTKDDVIRPRAGYGLTLDRETRSKQSFGDFWKMCEPVGNDKPLSTVLGERYKHLPCGNVSERQLHISIDSEELNDVVVGPENSAQASVVGQIHQIDAVRGLYRLEDQTRGPELRARPIDGMYKGWPQLCDFIG